MAQNNLKKFAPPITPPAAEIGQLSLDIYETPKEMIILAPVAGITLDDVNVSVTEDVLTIQGKRQQDFTVREEDYLIQECFWGKFSRSIVLPDYVDTGKVNASFKNGVLKITIPKTAGENKGTKLIKIKAS